MEKWNCGIFCYIALGPHVFQNFVLSNFFFCGRVARRIWGPMLCNRKFHNSTFPLFLFLIPMGIPIGAKTEQRAEGGIATNSVSRQTCHLTEFLKRRKDEKTNFVLHTTPHIFHGGFRPGHLYTHRPDLDLDFIIS